MADEGTEGDGARRAQSQMSDPVPRIESALRPDHVAGYVIGVIATLVAIGGLYVAKRLEATTAMAIVAAGSVAIWIGRASFRLVILEGRGHMGSCIPEGLAELRRSWPMVLAALPPVLALAAAAAKAWSVTVGLHIGQALGVCGLIAAGLLTARRLQATGWSTASYVLWLTASGLLVVGIELLARTA